MLEHPLQRLVQLEASQRGMRLWRNNRGAAYTDRGSFIRYGLANESAQMNKIIKSADLIGIRPVLITPALVGTMLGQFVSYEIKRPGVPADGAQMAWLKLILKLGGDARVISSIGEL